MSALPETERSPFPELAELAEAAALPPGAEREQRAYNAVFSLVHAAGNDEVRRQRIRAEVLRLKVMPAKLFDPIAAEACRAAAGFDGDADELGASRASGEVGGPEARVRMSSGAWRYSPGDDGYDRGLYVGDRFIASLPYVHARVVHRDGAGNRTGTSFLLSAAVGGPRLVTGHLKIRDGSWASELGITLPDEPKVIQAAGTAIRQLAEGAPEREAIARAVGDELAVPPRECLPDGYLVTSAMDRAAALSVWAREVLPLAARMPNLADMIGASAFSPFVGPLRIQSHILDAYGDADKGKTTALMAAASVWGDCREMGGAVRLWNFTSDVSVARFLGNLGVLPAFVDEGGASGFARDEWGKLVYRVAGGAQRIAAEYQGQGNKVGLPWHGIMFVTGNARLGDGLTAGKWAGIPKRLVESAAPFTTDAQHAERLEGVVGETFGHLGAEILARYTVADARRFHERAVAVVGMPEGGNPRTWAKELQAHVAGAMMLDEICGTGALLSDAAAAFAAAFLAEHCSDPKHDADLLLEAVTESMAREPVRWPTVAEYREHLRPFPKAFGGDGDASRTELPQHGVARLNMAGVRADDGSWVAVFPSAMHSEFIAARGIDSDRAFRELFSRGLLYVARSVRAKGEWPTPVRLMAKPARQDSMFKLVLPSVDEAEDEEVSGSPHVNTSPPVTPIPPIPTGQSDMAPPSRPPSRPPSPPRPDPNPAPDPPRAEGPAMCRGCHTLMSPWLREQGAEYHVGCAPAPAVARQRAVPAAELEQRPAAAPAADASPRRRWVVLGGDGRAYAAGGEVINLPGEGLAACTNAGELAALALELGAERCYVPREARAVLGLPESLGDPRKVAEGVPHIWTEATDPARWDIWPGEPVGLAGWMNVYRQPATLHEGVALAFPEWMENTPALGALGALELARALELIHLATTHHGEGRGGVEFFRSPAATFGRLVDKAARVSRNGRPEAVEMPAPYRREARRPRGAPAPLKVPGPFAGPAAEVPGGWIVARLDVRSCFASAVAGTDFGIGEAVHSKGGELGKAPGAHLVRVPALAAVHPSLMPFGPPAPGKGRDAIGWIDTLAARWLAEQGVPVVVLESWTWPETHRVFDSVSQRLGEARARLEAAGGVPELAAAAVVKSMPNAFLGGRLTSDYGGERRADDWQWRPDWWHAVRVQAEVRKQRNLLPAITAGAVTVLGELAVDSVYVAAPSLEVLGQMPGAGGRPAVAEARGKFKIESHAPVTGELSAALADARKAGRDRLAAVKQALGEE